MTKISLSLLRKLLGLYITYPKGDFSRKSSISGKILGDIPEKSQPLRMKENQTCFLSLALR
jgi:hypothetical protein